MVYGNMEMSKEDLLKLLWLQQKKIELLEKEKGRDDGLDYTAKIAHDPNTVESNESVEVIGEVHEPDSKS